MKPLTVLDALDEAGFVADYVQRNRPVVVRDLDFDPARWTPAAFRADLGDLPVQVYDALFDLQEVATLADYLDRQFGHPGDYREGVPYVRWYNQLKGVDHAWGDEAFARLALRWRMPSFLPRQGLLVPARAQSDATVDAFPYRGILVSARGARTRMHRDPFCSDAVVAQFHGVKEVAMYHPSRAEELAARRQDGSSFGGFLDVRGADLGRLAVEPDYHGFIRPGEVIYIPHGWLHDVIVVEDSISVTWNFVHERGSMEFIDYLMSGSESDSEFEVLRYFYRQSGYEFGSSRDIVKAFNQKFCELQELLEAQAA
ncbi:cupin-like domain-containing protein [Lysobacter enzymogenes]|uniref:cupin-like domain-containing protein n=1 Tax=Lysobacter enzymogenes TaxID=69 RepID=UPI00374A677A